MSLTLLCLLAGDSFDSVFRLSVSARADVFSLREQIKATQPSTLGHVDASRLTLWSVAVPYGDEPALQSLKLEQDSTVRKLLPLDIVGHVLSDPPSQHIHLIVEIHHYRPFTPPQIPVADIPSQLTPAHQRPPIAHLEALVGLHSELWGQGINHPTHKINVCNFEFYQVPGFKHLLEKAKVENFLLTGLSEVTQHAHEFRVLKTESSLPCGSTTLVVRQEYKMMESKLEDVFNNRVSRGFTDMIVSGQPGSGKTYFLSYLLASRLSKSMPTMFRDNDSACYLFDKTGCRMVTAAYLFRRNLAPEMRNLWILTDEAISDARWNDPGSLWFVVLAASPKKVAASHQWTKDRDVFTVYMDNWSWSEITSAFSLKQSDPTTEQLKRLYTTFVCFGPVARTCLKSVKAHLEESVYADSLKAYTFRLKEQIDYFVHNTYSTGIDSMIRMGSSHHVVLMIPTPDRVACTSQLITRWVTQQVAYNADRIEDGAGYRLYRMLMRNPSQRVGAGWFFEAYVHDRFLRGGKFTATPLPKVATDDNNQSLIFETKPPESDEHDYFTTYDDLVKKIRIANTPDIWPPVLDKYFRPYAKNQESFDGIVFNKLDQVILLQATTAKSHGIKTHGLERLVNRLPRTINKMHIVFVIPEDRIDYYTNVQGFQPLVANRDAPSELRNVVIKQYVLVLTDNELKRVAYRTYQNHDSKEDEEEQEKQENDEVELNPRCRKAVKMH